MSEQTKNNKLITILILILVALVAAFGVWYFNFSDDEAEGSLVQSSQIEETSQAQISQDGTTVSYDGLEGQSALALLKQYTDAQTEEFAGIGEYVVSINGLAADSNNNFWGFYVNGEQAQVGAGDYITKNNDQIEWRLEDVEAFQE